MRPASKKCRLLLPPPHHASLLYTSEMQVGDNAEACWGDQWHSGGVHRITPSKIYKGRTLTPTTPTRQSAVMMHEPTPSPGVQHSSSNPAQPHSISQESAVASHSVTFSVATVTGSQPQSPRSDREWTACKDNDGKIWWWHETTEELFHTSDPLPWNCYIDPSSDRYYWWRDDEHWFYQSTY